MRILKTKLFILTLLVSCLSAQSQSFCDTLPFILCDQNRISFYDSDSSLMKLIDKFQRINTANSDKIEIVHIGDSHLQAGFLTEQIRQLLFQYATPNDSFASPGFIFPYTIAHTNNPFFYSVQYTGDWTCSKNIDTRKSCGLGLSGITVSTKSANASFIIKMQNQKYAYPVKYYFDKVKLLHNSIDSFHIKINGKETTTKGGNTFLQLDHLTDSISVSIENNDTNKNVEIYGLILENDDSKINYHTIGVNGATAQSYLKCDFFSEHLSQINPDLIILSLGTNEAYDAGFSTLKHELELKDLIYQIRDIAPNTAIILITPNDHLKNRKDVNHHILKVRDNLLKISAEFQLSTWDFHTIMGGENSIQEWYEKGLTGEDKLHFKRRGYEIQGELFVKAFIKLIEKDDLK